MVGVAKCKATAHFGRETTVIDQLFLYDRTTMGDSCYTSGDVIIGAGSTIGNDNFISQLNASAGTLTVGNLNRIIGSKTGKNVTIGNNGKVITAVLGDNAKVLDDAVVIGAEIKNNTTVGRRSVIGSGSELADGITIGRDSCVGAGLVVTFHVPDESYVNADGVIKTIKSGRVIRTNGGDCVDEK